MELILNLAWLALSAALGIRLLAATHGRGRVLQERGLPRSARWVGYVVLIAVLLPAISMSDDLLAMVAPAEGDRIARRCDCPMPAPHPAKFHTARFLPGRSALFGSPAFSEPVAIAPAARPDLTGKLRNQRGRAPPAIFSSLCNL